MSSVSIPIRNPEPIEFRRAEAHDCFPAFAIRRKAILALAPKRMSSTEAQQWADGVSLQDVVHSIQRHVIWVATRAERVIGWVESDENRILRLFVDPHNNGDGIGGQLLKQAQCEVEREGHAEVRLETNQHAAPFYERRGYRRFPEGPPGEPMVLRKKLPASH